MNAPDFLDELRRLSTEDLEILGQRSMLDHVVAQAEVAKGKHGPLTFERLDALLRDPVCVRHPVRVAYEFGEMAMHQFAQPDLDWRDETGRGRVLYLRPLLRDRPDLALLAVAYFIPVLNYGDVATDSHCLAYGAALLGLTPDDFYQRLCILADAVGAESRLAGPVAASSCGCGGGRCR
jgi:hypothetical protein